MFQCQRHTPQFGIARGGEKREIEIESSLHSYQVPDALALPPPAPAERQFTLAAMGVQEALPPHESMQGTFAEVRQISGAVYSLDLPHCCSQRRSCCPSALLCSALSSLLFSSPDTNTII
jgi:hypothetical protein